MLIKQVKVELIKHQQQNKQTNKNENNQCTAHDYQRLTAKIWNQLRHYRHRTCICFRLTPISRT